MSGSRDSLPLILWAIVQLDICTADTNYCGPGFWYIVAESRDLPSAEMLSCCRLYRACTWLRNMTSCVVYVSVTLVYWPDAAASFHSVELPPLSSVTCLYILLSSRLWRERRHLFASLYPSFERESYHDDLPPWFSINIRSLRSTKDKQFWRGCCEQNPWQHTSWIQVTSRS